MYAVRIIIVLKYSFYVRQKINVIFYLVGGYLLSILGKFFTNYKMLIGL